MLGSSEQLTHDDNQRGDRMNYKRFKEALQARIDWQQKVYEFDSNQEALKIKHVLEDVLNDYNIYGDNND